MQLSALRAAGVSEEFLFVEKVSAVNAKRPQLHLMMKAVEPGDTIVTYAFNRFARDLKFLLTFVDDMKSFGVTLRSTSEPHIDPFTTNGRLLLSVTGAVDENERGRIRDRTRDGMQELKRQGMYLGRRKLFDDKQAAAIRRDRKVMTAKECAAKWKCSPATIDKYTR
jgi:DNA invertase Pin-like site-specific DNA recombinase